MWPFVFILATSGLCVGSLFYILMNLAPEASQGFIQKIFFFHVPAAFAMYACLIIAAIASGMFLFQRTKNWDYLGRANMAGALLFGLIVMVSGPIWAKPIWGVYWTWDPRLTTTFIVFILIIAYFFTRRVFTERRQEDRASIVGAILALIAVLDIPLIHLSVKLWRGVHPSVLNNPEGLPENFRFGLELMTLSMLCLAGLYVYFFHRILILEDQSRA